MHRNWIKKFYLKSLIIFKLFPIWDVFTSGLYYKWRYVAMRLLCLKEKKTHGHTVQPNASRSAPARKISPHFQQGKLFSGTVVSPGTVLCLPTGASKQWALSAWNLRPGFLDSSIYPVKPYVQCAQAAREQRWGAVGFREKENHLS